MPLIGGVRGDLAGSEWPRRDNWAAPALAAADQHEKRPARHHDGRALFDKGSGSVLLSHTETVQYHRLWRA